MRKIKTRSSVKNIKILDKGVNLSKRMKDAYVKTKERAEETQSPQHATPTEYAGDKIQDAARETAYDAVSYISNPRQKALKNWNRAKGHFEEVRRNLPKERRRAAEQAQKTAAKVKTNAENLRKTADKAGETARDAKAAVQDAKQHFKEVRQTGRQTLREVKQKVRAEYGGRTVKTKEITAHTPSAGETPRPASNATPAIKDVSHRPYMNKGVQTPKSAGDMAKAPQTPAKPAGQAIKSTRKGFKQTAKGTIKTAQKSVKTAEQSAKAAVRTAKHGARAAQKTAHAAVKTARAAEHAARAAAKTAVHLTKAAARAVAALVKISIAAVKGLVALIAAGGWMAVLIILIICMIGLLVGSVFGIFFAGDPNPDTGQTVGSVAASLDAEYTGRIDGIIAGNPHDSLEQSGERAEWREILAVYAVRTAADPANPVVVAMMDDGNAALLREVFWEMNVIDHWTEEIEHPDTDADDGEDDSWTERILHITVTGKTADEMAAQYSFTAEQQALLQELLSGEYDDLFAALLTGAEGITGENIVVVENGIYIWPSPVSKYVTSFFGNRPNPTTGAPDNHTGIDISAGYGTPVLAAADGVVVTAGFDADGYGIYCVIDHGNGNSTLYGHMSTRNVNEGDTVSQRQEIGLVGSTGWSTGNHIHFETRVNGSRVDPLLYFED